MNIEEMKEYLNSHGVEEGDFYTHGGLGGGEIDGIEEIDGVWHTYFSERGSKNGYRNWPSEEDAVAYVRDRAEALAKRIGYWKDHA